MRVWTDDRTRHGLLRRISRTRLSKPTRLGLGLRSRRWMGSRARLQTLALAVSTGTVFPGYAAPYAPPAPVSPPSDEAELEFLKSEAARLEAALKEINARIKELSQEDDAE